MIRKATEEDFEEIFNIINDAAVAYKGVIPPDRWHEPYMTKEELRAQIEDGVRFSCYIDNNEIIGVMGIQDKADVELIRHAYVRTKRRKKGVGSLLLQGLILLANSKMSDKLQFVGAFGSGRAAEISDKLKFVGHFQRHFALPSNSPTVSGTDKRRKEADFDRDLEGRRLGDPIL